MSLSLTQALETYAEKAAAMLAHIVGEALVKVEEEYITADEIYQQLSYIISYLEECGEMLHWRHDAATEEAMQNSIDHKLVSKGIISGKKALLKGKDQIKLNLNILLAQMGRNIMIHGSKGMHANLASVFNNKEPLKLPSIKYSNIDSIIKKINPDSRGHHVADVLASPAGASMSSGTR